MALVSNDSLTPTKLDPNLEFTPSSYPDKQSVVAAFRRGVQMALDNPEDRDALFRALREFHASKIVEDLMERLKKILDHPNRRIVYKYIRPLIPTRLRGEYKSLVPHIPSFDKKVVQLKLSPSSTSFGFSVRGGKEFGCGFYVTSVVTSSRAAQAGLKAGDQIVRVNGLVLSETTHEEFLNLMKLRKTYTLTLKDVGLIPVMNPRTREITWKAVVEARKWPSTVRIGTQEPLVHSTQRVRVTLQGGESFGANVKVSNLPWKGVMVVDVVPNSPAQNSGIKPGDEILAVNGINLVGLSHDEALHHLRASSTLMLSIRSHQSKLSHDSATGSERAESEFEFGPQDFDADNIALGGLGQGEEDTFTLQARVGGRQTTDGGMPRIPRANNLSTQPSKLILPLAAPAVEGYGPTFALPTLMGMVPQMDEDGDGPTQSQDPFDMSLISVKGLTPGRDDLSSPLNTTIPTEIPENTPDSVSKSFPKIGQATVAGDAKRKLKYDDERASSPPRPPQAGGAGGTDLTSYQFPVEEDNDSSRPPPLPTATVSGSASSRVPAPSALKKASPNSPNGTPTKSKRPTFSDDVEVIPDQRTERLPSAAESVNSVHPSNLSFSDEVLQGRKVKFHTIPKTKPLRIAIRGGRDTPIGGQIIISQILDGGAAADYGQLNVGDQILVCDGINLINITHEEAGQIFKRAMDMESETIDLVVAVNSKLEET